MGARTDFVRAMLFGVVIGVAITTAFFQLRRSPSPSAPAIAPDRIAERDALLVRAKPALDACGQGVSPPISIMLGLHIDDQGELAAIDQAGSISLLSPAGQITASCVESAISRAASFAASPNHTYLPLTVSVGN